MTDKQYQLPRCLAPCWPITCYNCPFGDENTTLEQVQEWIMKQATIPEAA